VALLPNSFSSLRLISSQTAFCSSESQNFFTSYPQTHEKSGIKIKAARESSVLLKRPNDLYIHAEGEDGSATTIWFDGSKLTMWRHDVNEVMSLDFKGTTDAMLDHVIDETAKAAHRPADRSGPSPIWANKPYSIRPYFVQAQGQTT
jgi:hypothetical protein